MKNKFLALFLAFAILFTFSSCGKKSYEANAGNASYDKGYVSEDSYDAAVDYEYELPMTDGMAEEPKEDYYSGGSDYSTTATQNDLANRKIIKNANISFQTTTYDEFMSSVRACIASYGGYTERSESYGGGAYQGNYSRSASITARIPADRYESFMNEVTTLGSVTHRSENSEDVTSTYVDTESRIKALETEYSALISILEKATKLEDVITLQSRISDVTYQLESYKARLRKYDDLISYCTVYLNITEVKKEVVNEEKLTVGERMTEGLNDTVEEIKTDLEDFSVNFVSALPYIAIWLVIIAVFVIIIVNTFKKRKKKSAKGKKDEAKESEEK